MKFANISLGSDVEIDISSSINNVKIGDNVKIAKNCSIYGGKSNVLELGANSYVGMHSILNGYAAKLEIGKNVSISQFVNIMVDSGPNASPAMQQIYPIEKGPVFIGDNCWIGSNSVIAPNVSLGKFCVVGANSFVNKSFPDFSIIGGTPAKIIKSFSEDEKEILLRRNHLEKENLQNNSNAKLPFEDTLRKYRRKKTIETIKKHPHDRILEVGCGADPLFQYLDDYEKMVVVEYRMTFSEIAKSLVLDRDNIIIINDLIENVAKSLKSEKFNYVIVGGFLHEIDNPDEVLKTIYKICSKDTIVYSFVPNANSFHRLLAQKMGAIANIYQKSGHDLLYDRQSVFNINSYNELFTRNNFEIIKSGTYFVKPFTHKQMQELINYEILDKSFLNGLYKMIEYIPDLGTEIWNTSKIR